MKKIKAVAPYWRKDGINFKTQAYEAWVKVGGQVTSSYYPPRFLHRFAFNYELPTFGKNKEEARLRFVEPVSISFDTFPDYAAYEIIPFIWDCWPCYFEKICAWFKKHDVQTAIFTSSQTAERMRERFPEMNVMHCPEGVDTSRYTAGKPLSERSIDLLEFGRKGNIEINSCDHKGIRYVCTKVGRKYLYSNEKLAEVMGDAKVTIALPRNITDPQKAGDIETLTQRYWENMLSRMVMVGHAPQELIDFIGYNPVIELDKENPDAQIMDIITHIEDFQDMVDKNRSTALEKGDWAQRMNMIKRYLIFNNYIIKR